MTGAEYGYRGASPYRLQRRSHELRQQPLETYPGVVIADAGALAAAIDASSDCAQACTADVDADLGEQNLAEMVRCIGCAWMPDVPSAIIGVINRQADHDPGVTRPLLEACVAICKSCGDECGRHAPHHEHCRVCEQACRRCEQACRELLGALK